MCSKFGFIKTSNIVTPKAGPFVWRCSPFTLVSLSGSCFERQVSLTKFLTVRIRKVLMLIPPYYFRSCIWSQVISISFQKVVASSLGARLQACCPKILLFASMTLIKVRINISFRRKPLLGRICVSFVKLSLQGMCVIPLKPVRLNNAKYVGFQT